MRTQSDLFETAPYQPQSASSAKAAAAILPAAETLRRKVLDAIKERGDYGATDDELQLLLGMDGSTERPRRVELWEKLLIKQKPDTYRPTRSGRLAVVWVAA